MHLTGTPDAAGKDDSKLDCGMLCTSITLVSVQFAFKGFKSHGSPEGPPPVW